LVVESFDSIGNYITNPLAQPVWISLFGSTFFRVEVGEAQGGRTLIPRGVEKISGTAAPE